MRTLILCMSLVVATATISAEARTRHQGRSANQSYGDYGGYNSNGSYNSGSGYNSGSYNYSSGYSSFGGYGGGSSLAGHKCSARDTDPTVCKVCAIYGEDHNSPEGMAAVAGVIATRQQAGNWGSDACRIVHGRGQFVGAWHRLPNNPVLLSQIQSESNAGANGYLGFRSRCGHGRSVKIGARGNCYGSADASKEIELDPTMTAEDVDKEAEQNATLQQYAEAVGYPDDAG